MNIHFSYNRGTWLWKVDDDIWPDDPEQQARWLVTMYLNYGNGYMLDHSLPAWSGQIANLDHRGSWISFDPQGGNARMYATYEGMKGPW